jgi:hypothetical protein
MQVAQRRQRDLREADLDGAAIDWVELPGRHHRDNAGLKLELSDRSTVQSEHNACSGRTAGAMDIEQRHFA